MCLIGAELDIPNASVERNEGLHPGLIDFRRLENVVGLIDSRLTKPVNPLLRKLDPRPGLSLMSAENRERFLSYYAESNARVARRYLGKQDGVLFAGPEGEAAEDLLEADAYLSTILSCAYNDMMAKMVGAERRRSDLQAEVDRISTELTSLRRVERELISLRAEVDALRTGPSSLSTLDKGANRPQPGVQVESSDRNAFWRSLLRRLIWRE